MDGSFTKIWDSLGSNIGVPDFCKAPTWGFTLPSNIYIIDFDTPLDLQEMQCGSSWAHYQAKPNQQ